MDRPSQLKILYFVGSFPGTYISFIRNQIETVMQQGHEVHIVSSNLDRDDLQNSVFSGLLAQGRVTRSQRATSWRNLPELAMAVATLTIRQPSILVQVFRLWRTAGRSIALETVFSARALLGKPDMRFDILHAQYGTQGILVDALRRSGIVKGNLVVSFRGSDLSNFLKTRGPRAYRSVIENADVFLPVSEFFSERLRILGADSRKIHIIRSGIDLSTFDFRPRALPHGRAIRVLSVGRLVEKKGHDHCINAVSALLREGHEINFSIIGEGRLRPALERQIAALAFGDSVSLTGELPHAQVIARMMEADILLNHSVTTESGDQEGIPNVVKEAMACGLPVIASRHAGTPELVLHEETGLLVEEGDEDGIADTIRRIVGGEIDVEGMVREANRKVRGEYDRDAVLKALIQAYQGSSGVNISS